MYHSDPLGLIASGLFDGARVSYDLPVGSFYAGAWYTGLLYKKRNSIEMTAANSEGYSLGNEFSARLMWSPFNGIQVRLGGGIFLPSMGDVAPNEANVWRVELNVILNLY